ncbi:helix-hairpin-helix domain-containing protein [Pectinatus frisingensis]|uniref:helix-hairpin-helix domain-containing protein n=1 Tax=Pectinatus frisingensis TaxID=865 RepID=UPI0018C59B3B|nr:helix-hairpin-helix domain-containing protein [Pectinatus frisingensis]
MPMYRKQLIVLLTIIAIVAAITYYVDESGKSVELEAASTNENMTVSPMTVENGNKLVVYVTGAVNSPGVIELPEGSRIVDAVNKCGGMNESADTENINLAQKITDAAQIKIPIRSENTNTVSLSDGKSNSIDNNRVNINTADESVLDTLPGIGPAMAKRIVEYRQNQGNFQSIDDLKKVRGIGEAKYIKLKDKITI